MQTAQKDSWKIEPMPEQTAVLSYMEEFPVEDFEKISQGLIPEEMEDKWFIYFDGKTLHLHRSWTGECIYQVEFEEIAGKYVVHRALVNRNTNQYLSTDDIYDTEVLHFLISNLLLNRNIEFPVARSLANVGPKGLFQHSISGTAYPEKFVGKQTASHKPWWKFW